MNTSYLLELAHQRLDCGQLDGAMDALRQLLGEDPDCAQAHALLAFCLLDLRRLHAATHEAQLALANEPELELALHAAAAVALASRQFQTARQYIDRLLSVNPFRSSYHRLLAELQHLRGKPAEQLQALTRALELEPDGPDSLAAMADYHRSQGARDQAEHFASQALAIQPDHAGALVCMGFLLLRRGEVEAAREHAVWVLQHDAGDVQALYLLSAVKARSNPLLGTWWRYNSWMLELGSIRSIIMLLVLFVCYRAGVIFASQQGYEVLAEGVQWAWLALVLYSFAAPQMFKRSLEKELAGVKLSRDF